MSRALRSGLALLAAVTFALGVAGWQAKLHWDTRNPEPDAVIHLGETVQLDGASFRLDTFVAAPRLPSNVPEEEWVVAPDGALLVHVTITTEITDDDVDPTQHYCFATAVDAAQREWQTDTSVGYKVDGPAATSCTGVFDEPIQPHEPLAVGFVFLVPADAVDTLVVDLSLGYRDPTLRLSR